MTDAHFPHRRRSVPGAGSLVLAILAVAALLAGAAYLGVYDVGADAPHSKAVYWTIEQLRRRSIAVRAARVVAPANLEDPRRIASGAALYAEMCSGCHLAPGMKRTEISQGLYPQAPELSRGTALSPAESFWVIKHGVKLTAMPAWGRTHSDALIWDMVAFLNRLPSLSAAQYQAAVSSAPADHDAMMRETNGAEGAMPEMSMPGGGPR
jgi:mono/diheme cytochrome c family protein